MELIPSNSNNTLSKKSSKKKNKKIINNDLSLVNNKIIKEGENILNKNDFFKKLMNLMNSGEFKDFYDSYFNDWSDIETIIFYIKLYKTIAYEYNNRFNEEINDEIMSYMLYNVMLNEQTRKLALEKFRDFKEHKNIDMEKNKDFRYLLDFSKYSIVRTTSQLTYINNNDNISKLDELLKKI
jgi:hypothetical protein